jgi:ribosome-associated toxin RatA of RatAB toxin-antitoxin module
MRTENAVLIRAPLAEVYALAAAVERWPEILPHYRYVRVREERGRVRLVEMAARRDWIPVWWMALQESDPDVPEIRFRHVRGITTGMEVVWSFVPEANGVRVSIRHDLDLTWPLVGRLIADRIIGPLFVESIAGRTLARIKRLAEAGAVTTTQEAIG